MTQEIKAKREELKALSAAFKIMVKSGAIDSINTGLVQYYAELGHTTIYSYKRWREQGFQVKKGSKALLLWGEPKPRQKQEEPKQEGEKEETFFPLAYVFSNLQVEQIK